MDPTGPPLAAVTALPGRSGVRFGMRAALPLCVAVGAFGVSFGVLARAAGWGPVAPVVMSLTTFTGASQFASVAILRDGGGAGAAIVAAVLLASRYVPIGLSVAPSIEGPPWKRFLHAQLIIDESWAVANQGGGRVDGRTLLGAGIALYLSWQLGTVIGVIGGDFVGDPQDLGLDAAFPALFLALVVPQLRGRTAIAAALLGGTIALALVPFTRPGIPIVVASLACLVGWRRR
jgi:4-azaleucine resistance transporter AzlC